MTKAIYSGVFDPFTKKHMETIEIASKMYSQLFIVLINDSNANPIKERFDSLKTMNMPENVMILMLPKGLISTMARQMHIKILIASYENQKELEKEKEIAKENRKYQSHIQTIFIEI